MPLQSDRPGASRAWTAHAHLNHVQGQLHSAPVDASTAAVRLNANIPGHTTTVRDFAIDPATNQAVYVADQEIESLIELYRVPIDGRLPARRVNAQLLSVGSSAGVPGTFAGPGARVVYLAAQETVYAQELYLDQQQLEPTLIRGRVR